MSEKVTLEEYTEAVGTIESAYNSILKECGFRYFSEEILDAIHTLRKASFQVGKSSV